ncbi:MAG TPA: efflux RND transporter periplasmic adaptor subunit [Gemmatales bacterium]|nr:efflux RND transporter periplasmic adaptor subunit [Gemmatales bacterium]
MKPSRTRQRILWALILLVACGGGYFWWSRNRAAHAARETLPTSTAAKRDTSIITVTTFPLKTREVQRTIEAVGTFYGFDEVTISAKVEGRVRKLHHDVSDRVKPGELLIEIDPTDYELSVNQSEKSLQVEAAKMGVLEPPPAGVDVTQLPAVRQASIKMDNAKARLERAQAAGPAVTKEDLMDRQAEVRITEAEYQNQILQMKAIWATVLMKKEALAMSRQQLKDTQIFAATPISSIPLVSNSISYVVTHRPVAEGTFVRVGTELCKLAIDQTLKLRLLVPERYGSEVKLGQRTMLYAASYSQPFEGKVTRINPAIETATRTFEVEVQVPNPQGKLRPGGFAKAYIETHKDASAQVVPISALVSFAGITKIYVVDNGKAKAITVNLGVQTSDWVEILTPPLPKNAQVITSGQSALADGSPISIREKT